jgi:hypothetical protein
MMANAARLLLNKMKITGAALKRFVYGRRKPPLVPGNLSCLAHFT